jgi:drug/metabolite transporter (DMT)-like permease
MTLAMAGFALEDLIIKILSDFMPVSQILIYVGVFAGILFLIIAKIYKTPVVTNSILYNRPVIIRTFTDMFGALFIVTSISLLPLSTVSSILQATPLLVTLGAALIFKESVGWRRWSAVFIGFLGVVLILKPGLNGFHSSSLLALLGVVFLAMRDLITRRIESDVPSLAVSIYAFFAAALGGVVSIPFSSAFVTLNAQQWLMIFAATLVGCFSYLALVLATRAGDISTIAPFRYTRLVFALILAVFVLKERPDSFTLLGASIIIVSGCYTFWRENFRRSEKYNRNTLM